MRLSAMYVPRPGAATLLALVCILLASGAAGCRTVPRLPVVDLKEPGWTVRCGQAVWHLPQGRPELAGELLVATRERGRSWVQFSKTPFPLVTAQTDSGRWQVEFPPQNKHYSGRGGPPRRLIWLFLPRVLSGQTPPRGWSWRQDANGWRLENPANGESLEGYFES